MLLDHIQNRYIENHLLKKSFEHSALCWHGYNEMVILPGIDDLLKIYLKEL